MDNLNWKSLYDEAAGQRLLQAGLHAEPVDQHLRMMRVMVGGAEKALTTSLPEGTATPEDLEAVDTALLFSQVAVAAHPRLDEEKKQSLQRDFVKACWTYDDIRLRYEYSEDGRI